MERAAGEINALLKLFAEIVVEEALRPFNVRCVYAGVDGIQYWSDTVSILRNGRSSSFRDAHASSVRKRCPLCRMIPDRYHAVTESLSGFAGPSIHAMPTGTRP